MTINIYPPSIAFINEGLDTGMRYKAKNIDIRSENAAKPASQPARAVVDWIKRQNPVKNALDFGCGKLRYAKYLAEKCDHLTLVDSRIQISRLQIIGNRRTTVRDYASANWPHAEIYAIDEFWKRTRIIKGAKALYVLVPLIVAIFSRVIKLHDKISDLFLIRQIFDTKYILIRLAQKVGSNVKPDIIKKNRRDAMYKVFYPYAGFKNPAIDAQLVRSALDNWGWYWVELEAACIFLLTMLTFLATGRVTQTVISLLVALLIIGLSFYQHSVCISIASAAVNAIIDDDERKKEILTAFSSLKCESSVE